VTSLDVDGTLAAEHVNRIPHSVFTDVVIVIVVLVTKDGMGRVEQIDGRRIWQQRERHGRSEKVAKVGIHGIEIGKEGRVDRGEESMIEVRRARQDVVCGGGGRVLNRSGG
jgi:hypothetical protein